MVVFFMMPWGKCGLPNQLGHHLKLTSLSFPLQCVLFCQAFPLVIDLLLRCGAHLLQAIRRKCPLQVVDQSDTSHAKLQTTY